ncbi:RNA polymerase sigma factor [Streptomyces europaeiscabiei]|uniref:RNA polymerase sigma factor n=1 Tax=Streptomyces europaeiscabiei TaxID=146819 RepID=UPI0038F6FB61
MNEGEFNSFFRQEYRRLVLHLTAEGIDAQTAKDAVQEAMVQAYLNWKEILSPKAWVRKVALRTAWRTSYRNEMRRRKEEEDHHETPKKTESGSDEYAAAIEEQQEVLRTLLSLPSAQRHVMALLFDGYTTSEIAKEMGVSSATVRSHLRHARQRLCATPLKLVAQEVVVKDE